MTISSNGACLFKKSSSLEHPANVEFIMGSQITFRDSDY